MLAKQHQNIGVLLSGMIFISRFLFVLFFVVINKYRIFHPLLIMLLNSTTALLTLFSQIMVNVNFPYVIYRKGYGLEVKYFALFKLFPV